MDETQEANVHVRELLFATTNSKLKVIRGIGRAVYKELIYPEWMLRALPNGSNYLSYCNGRYAAELYFLQRSDAFGILMSAVSFSDALHNIKTSCM